MAEHTLGLRSNTQRAYDQFRANPPARPGVGVCETAYWLGRDGRPNHRTAATDSLAAACYRAGRDAARAAIAKAEEEQ